MGSKYTLLSKMHFRHSPVKISDSIKKYALVLEFRVLQNAHKFARFASIPKPDRIPGPSNDSTSVQRNAQTKNREKYILTQYTNVYSLKSNTSHVKYVLSIQV